MSIIERVLYIYIEFLASYIPYIRDPSRVQLFSVYRNLPVNERGVIMVATWFTWPGDDVTVNNIDVVGRSLRWRWLSGRQVTDRVWINSRSRRHFHWICNFWIPRRQGGIILGLQSNCGHPIDINMSIWCEIVRLSGKVAGSHFDRPHTAFYLIANEVISFDVSLIS